jgi:dTMP kinase
LATVAEEIAALRGTRSATLKDLLTHPSFSRLWRAMLVSSMGDWVGFVAVASLVAGIGGKSLGGLAVAGVILSRLAPSVLFGAFAGVLVDRFDRKKVMVMADLGRAALYATMPLLPRLWLIFLVSFFIESLSLVWTPAKDASVPNLVPRRQLSNANSVGLMTTYGTLPLGATIYTALAGVATAIGGYLGQHPEALALWADALTFLFSARMVSRLDLTVGTAAARRKRRQEGQRFSLGAAFVEVREGIRFLREHPLVRVMTIGIVLAFVGGGAVISLGPVFAQYTVNAGATGFGYLMIALGVGMAVGMAAMGWITKRIDKERLFGPAIMVSAGCLLVLAGMPTIGLAALWTVPMGATAGLAWVSGYTLLQENVSDDFRGRTFATLNVMVRVGMFVSLLFFPAIYTALSHTGLQQNGTRVALAVGAAIVAIGGGFSWRAMGSQRIIRPRPLALIPKLVPRTLSRLRRTEQGGVFIVFEGVEGAGKGTQLTRAKEFVESLGREVVVCREPGGTRFGERLRETILDPSTGRVDARAEALLFAAARAQLVSTVIRPALAEGKVVLCDRFIDSSVAYQGAARGLGEPDILTLNAWATQGLFPDLVLLLHLDPDEGLARATGELDRIESEDAGFHERVADAYLRIAEEHPERFVVIDASQTPDVVQEKARAAIGKAVVPQGDRRGGDEGVDRGGSGEGGQGGDRGEVGDHAERTEDTSP